MAKETGHIEESKNKRTLGKLRPFFLVADKAGRLVSGEMPPIEHPEDLIQALIDWKPERGDFRYFTVEDEEDRHIDLVFAGLPLKEDGEFSGTVYAGADVSAQNAVLRKLMSILIGLSALFVLLSALLGYFMSGRAMKPIAQAFERQRRFVSDASHELRTPLTVMHASLEVLESEEGRNIKPFSKQVHVCRS